LKDNIRCVILNACYSEQQAGAIAEHIDCVIGMTEAIGDKAAISFASAFYQALGYGRDVKTAFDLGCVQIGLEDLEEHDIPVLKSISADPGQIVFVRQDHSKVRALLLQEIDHNIKYLSDVYHQVRSEQKKYEDTFQTDGMGGWSSEGNPLGTLTGFSPSVLSQKVWTSEMLQASKELSQQELEAVFSFYGKMAQIVSAQEKFQRFMESKSTSSTRLVSAGNLLEDVMNKIEDVLHHHPNPLSPRLI
jgi:hypothetical protein